METKCKPVANVAQHFWLTVLIFFVIGQQINVLVIIQSIVYIDLRLPVAKHIRFVAYSVRKVKMDFTGAHTIPLIKVIAMSYPIILAKINPFANANLIFFALHTQINFFIIHNINKNMKMMEIFVLPIHWKLLEYTSACGNQTIMIRMNHFLCMVNNNNNKKKSKKNQRLHNKHSGFLKKQNNN